MTFKHTLIVGALFGIAALTAQAQTVSINQNGSLVEMCASAEKQVAHDTAVMNIEMVATERDKVQAADKVNATMAQAVRMIKQKYPTVVFENANYNTYQERDEDGQPIKKWTVRQSYTLTSKKITDITEIAAQLQGMGIQVGSMNTYLSPEGRRLAALQLDDMAFADVKARIASVAKAFGQPVSAWRVAHMNTMPNNPCNGYSGRMYAAPAAMMKAEMVSDAVAQPELVEGRESMAVNFYIAVRAK